MPMLCTRSPGSQPSARLRRADRSRSVQEWGRYLEVWGVEAARVAQFRIAQARRFREWALQ
jgi:hypothetical protein